MWQKRSPALTPNTPSPSKAKFTGFPKKPASARALASGCPMGLTVFGTASSQKGLDLATREGAHQVFDHSKPGYLDEIMKATGGRGVDIVLEMLANVNLANDMKLLATNGRIIVIGSRGEISINPRELMARRGSIRAFTLWALTPAEETQIH